MPSARGNQPMSTGSNYNVPKYNKKSMPKKNNKIKLQGYKTHRKNKTDNFQSKIINKLSKQVYGLQMAQYGKVQQNFQALERALIPTGAQPCAMDLNDLTCIRGQQLPLNSQGAIVFQHTTGSGFNSASHWARPPPASNVYWADQNLDAVDTGAYLHLNSTYYVDVRGNRNLDNTRVRFDLIAQRPDAVLPREQLSSNPSTLPWTLGSMKHLAEPHRNRINPTYFKKYFSKTVFINSQPSGDSGVKATTANIQRFSFTVRPKKLITQLETNPVIQDVPIVDQDTGTIAEQEEILYGNFGPLNVPVTQPLWLVISTDDATSVNDAVEVRISRRCVWRDHIGSANL